MDQTGRVETIKQTPYNPLLEEIVIRCFFAIKIYIHYADITYEVSHGGDL